MGIATNSPISKKYQVTTNNLRMATMQAKKKKKTAEWWKVNAYFLENVKFWGGQIHIVLPTALYQWYHADGSKIQGSHSTVSNERLFW